MHLALLLVLWLHLLQAPFLTLIFVVDRFKLYCTRSSLYSMVYRVQAFCLDIICSDPQGVLQVFPIQEFSTKNAENFVFLSFKPQPFLSFHTS